MREWHFIVFITCVPIFLTSQITIIFHFLFELVFVQMSDISHIVQSLSSYVQIMRHVQNPCPLVFWFG